MICLFGWRKAFGKDLCKELDNILGDYRNNYTISQIKEKWGFLHWYDNGIPTEISNKYNHWLDKYEEKSKHTCMICGKKGEIDYQESWLSPLCESCRRKMNDRKL